MEVQKIEAQLVYCKSFNTTLREIMQYVGSVPTQMAEEIKSAGGQIVAAPIWQYVGTDGEPDTPFELTIAFPIKEQLEGLPGTIKELAPFQCVVHTHKGSWEEFKTVYPEFIGRIAQAGKQAGDVCREVYHQVDFENPENNVTEIQMSVL